MFGLGFTELVVIALIGLPMVLLVGVMLKKMGYSDLIAVVLAVLMLAPLNLFVLAYLVFFKWPIHEELELLRRRVDENPTPTETRPTMERGGSNPLHVSIEKGYADVVEALISQGVDLDAKTTDGQTPLQLAIACQHDEIAGLLRRHGASG